MLLSLHVKNLALIREEEIDLTDGLNILTGETGAGKSILIGSVGLVLGAKADRGLIRTGADSALIEMVFKADNDNQIRVLKEMGLEPDEEGVILVKRRILPSRSVCTVAGETVTLRQLREIAGLLIDICGQRENQKLLSREAQLGTVDAYAGAEAEDLKTRLSGQYREYRALCREWEKDDLDENARRRETDLLRYEIREIEEASLVPGEDEELEQRRRKLASFKKIQEAAAQADHFVLEMEGNAADQVDRALRALSDAEGCDEQLDALTGQLSEIDGLLSDFGRALTGYISELSFDPRELAQIEERLDMVRRLEDKHGGSIEAVLQALDASQQRLALLEDYENQRLLLKQRMEVSYRELLDVCKDLSALRKRAGEDFALRMREELKELNFPAIGFELSWESGEQLLSAEGYDRAVFMISLNPGEPMRPLDQIASGGELSRIMLAQKTVFAGRDEIHTFVFDEIDTGISGRTAWKVSQRLGQLAGSHQIICITHLPQIAAMEDSHFLIEKESEGGRTQTHIRRLTEPESCRELARLLGSDVLTDAALQNAEDMKQLARETKKDRS